MKLQGMITITEFFDHVVLKNDTAPCEKRLQLPNLEKIHSLGTTSPKINLVVSDLLSETKAFRFEFGC